MQPHPSILARADDHLVAPSTLGPLRAGRDV